MPAAAVTCLFDKEEAPENTPEQRGEMVHTVSITAVQELSGEALPGEPLAQPVQPATPVQPLTLPVQQAVPGEPLAQSAVPGEPFVQPVAPWLAQPAVPGESFVQPVAPWLAQPAVPGEPCAQTAAPFLAQPTVPGELFDQPAVQGEPFDQPAVPGEPLVMPVQPVVLALPLDSDLHMPMGHGKDESGMAVHHETLAQPLEPSVAEINSGCSVKDT